MIMSFKDAQNYKEYADSTDDLIKSVRILLIILLLKRQMQNVIVLFSSVIV